MFVVGLPQRLPGSPQPLTRCEPEIKHVVNRKLVYLSTCLGGEFGDEGRQEAEQETNDQTTWFIQRAVHLLFSKPSLKGTVSQESNS